MLYLIDGHNLIPKLGLSLRDIDDETRLIAILSEFCRLTRSRAHVFFDKAPPGWSGTRRRGLLTIHYVHERRTADDAIRGQLQALGKAARNWTVVSSDREVRAAARRSGALSLTSEAFAARIRQSQQAADEHEDEKPTPSSDDIDEWLRLFSASDEDGI